MNSDFVSWYLHVNLKVESPVINKHVPFLSYYFIVISEIMKSWSLKSYAFMHVLVVFAFLNKITYYQI